MKTILTLLLLLYSLFLAAQTFYPPIPPGGPDKNRINLVILSDGYTATQADLFYTPAGSPTGEGGDAWDLVREFEVTSPFREYRNYFDIYRVFIPSNNSGVIHPRNGQDCEPINSPPLITNLDHNHFGSSLDNKTYDGGIRFHRLLLADVGKVNSFIQEYFANVSVTTVVIANTDEWAGGADMVNGITHICGRYTRNIINPGPTDYTDERVAMHELGHSFGMLLDEYYYEQGVKEAANMTAHSDWSDPSHTWHHWYGVTTNPPIGNHAHHAIHPCLAQPYGTTAPWYKPTTGAGGSHNGKCKMEETRQPFCAVCKEALIERIHSLVSPVQGYSPSNEEPFSSTDSPLFQLDLVEPNPSYIRVRWFFNDILQDEDFGAAIPCSSDCAYEWQFDPDLLDGLPPGCYRVRAEIYDMTGNAPDAENSLVRISSHDNHLISVEWTFAIDQPSTTDLYMLDRNPELDNGDDEGYLFDWYYDEGHDIWVRHDDDGLTEQAHQDPDFSSSPEYVYVKVRNKGCKTSAVADLEIYASLAATSTSWPGDWDGTNSNGYMIGSLEIPPIPGGAEAILEFEWDITSVTPEQYEEHNWKVCLLARIANETGDPIIVDPDHLEWDVWHNNNVTMKNVTVIDFDNLAPGPVINQVRMAPGGFVRVANTRNTPQSYTLQFDFSSQLFHSTGGTGFFAVVAAYPTPAPAASNLVASKAIRCRTA